MLAVRGRHHYCHSLYQLWLGSLIGDALQLAPRSAYDRDNLFGRYFSNRSHHNITTVLLMPILAAAAMGAGIDPMLLMIPAAMSASCAFMLPVATPPNVVTFSTGRFSIQDMVREGLALNLIGVLIISLCFLLPG